MELKEFVEYLMKRPWDDKNHAAHKNRVKFLNDPETVMDEQGLIRPEDRAYVCSLRPDEIADRAGINPHTMRQFAKAMYRDDLWPAPGDIRKHYWQDNTVCPKASGLGEGEVGTLWSRPEHRIHKVYTETLYKNRENEFVVVGEGFLPNAQMTFKSKGINPPHEFHVACLPDPDHYHSCSIRQVYIRAFIDVSGAPCGSYEVFIANLGWVQEPPLGVHAQVVIEDHPPSSAAAA